MKIYAEWILHRKFYNGFFDRWEDFYKSTFNPCCDIKVVKVVK